MWGKEGGSMEREEREEVSVAVAALTLALTSAPSTGSLLSPGSWPRKGVAVVALTSAPCTGSLLSSGSWPRKGVAVAALTSAPCTGSLLSSGSWPRNRITRSSVDSVCLCSCIHTGEQVWTARPCVQSGLSPHLGPHAYMGIGDGYAAWACAPPLFFIALLPHHLLLVYCMGMCGKGMRPPLLYIAPLLPPLPSPAAGSAPGSAQGGSAATTTPAGTRTAPAAPGRDGGALECSDRPWA